MKKVIIIGCCGSGKSTFARYLHACTGIPLYHLDQLNWNVDKTTVEKTVFLERVRDVIQKDSWIIDGNYGSSIEIRMQACDTVFFLDYPVDICIQGIYDRVGKVRTDMPWIEDEVDEDLIEFVKNYEKEDRPEILNLLSKYKEKDIHIFHTREDAKTYLDSLKQLLFVTTLLWHFLMDYSLTYLVKVTKIVV